ncbi:MAG: Ref family recombination enhancement nuclease [Rhodanobacter sp.]
MACKLNQSPMWRCKMNIEIHHLLSGGRRIGHDASIALCHWHHQAKRFPSTTSGYTDQAKHYGPSLEREPRRFHEVYGTDDELLDFQEALLAQVATA